MKSIRDLRIVFFGTPEFAVASLQAVVDAGGKVLAVVTAPDKPSGRGLKLQPSAVKEYAMGQGITVLQPPKLKDPAFQKELQVLGADVFVVVAFRMLPESVWNMPAMGTINVHASLLPQYRGAAPINWAIINGETETGVTTFRLKHQIDTGDILLKQSVTIESSDNAGILHDKLMTEGARLLVKTLNDMAAGTIREQPQIQSEALYHAPKIFKDDMRIDWTSSAEEVNNLIRGLAPYPGAFTDWNNKMLKIYAAHIKEEDVEEPGSWETDGKNYLRFAASDAWVYIDELQLEGKKRLKTEDFLRGYRS